MRIVINPKYQYLSEYLSHIDEHFEREGRELHRGRNMLRTLQVEGLTLVVKTLWSYATHHTPCH